MNREPAASKRAGWPAELAVLVSGGLDSAILVGEALRGGSTVHPLYVRHGLAWEDVEQRHLRRFLEAIRQPGLRSLTTLDLPVADLYGDHWGLTGRDVPGADTPDEAVLLPGRNVLMLAKGMLWCHREGIRTLALAVLRGNPFPDATPEFFSSFQDSANRGLGGAVQLLRPYAQLGKIEVLHRGRDLPLEGTFSCIRPSAGLHCGLCNKCAERRRAFSSAGLEDHTSYQAPLAGAR